jgi:hypothetical protein
MQPTWGEKEEVVSARREAWAAALDSIGDNVVLTSTDAPTNSLERKGYKALKVPEGIARAGEVYKVRTPDKVMGEDERLGREIIPATKDALDALRFTWENIVLAGMTKEKGIVSRIYG